jgi:hypothetical protein
MKCDDCPQGAAWEWKRADSPLVWLLCDDCAADKDLDDLEEL